MIGSRSSEENVGVSGGGSGSRRRKVKEALLGYLYLLPAIVILGAFHFFPVGYAFFISLHSWRIKKGSFIALENYAKALQDPAFWNSLKVTVFYVIGTVPFQLAIALLVAYLLFQNIRGKSALRVIYFLPYITSTVASAAVWTWIFTPRAGPLNQILEFLGIEPFRWLLEPKGIFEVLAGRIGMTIPDWAAGPSVALVAVMIFVIWFWVGYDATIFLAGLGNIPYELYEAARIDGAGRWQLFRYITLPLLSPTTFFLSLIAVIGSFQAFNHIFVMTGAAGGAVGGPLRTTTTTTILIYQQFYESARFGYASSISFLLFAIILALTLLQNYMAGKRVHYS
jgi:multiple sugar transport system permease protein